LRVYIETYGCALAHFDTELMKASLRARGHLITEDPGEADVIVVNTCAVRLDTEQRIVKRIREIRRLYPAKKLVVAGCLAAARPGLIARVAPEASMVSPQNSSMIWKAVESPQRVILLGGERDTSWIPKLGISWGVATIMIQEGCLGDCSFCITKKARRVLRSYEPRVIVETVRDLIARGAKEIRLTGQDTAAYGYDLPGKPTLADLVNTILERVPGDYRIRIGMMTPEQAMRIMDDLLNVYEDERVYKFFHIPVQSGSDKVLRIMNRKYTVSDYEALVGSIRSKFPDAMVATDIIVGHPGEDEDDFEATLDLVRRLEFDRVHVAQYTIRPHTRSASMPQLPDSAKKDRSRRLMRLVEEVGLKRHRRYVGLEADALVAGRAYRTGSLLARLDNYYPVIAPANEGGLVGRWVRVRILDATYYDLRGVILGPTAQGEHGVIKPSTSIAAPER
jgi:threonylcarbamoyladenosine tRNA methylthiotransferase CDKAL1